MTITHRIEFFAAAVALMLVLSFPAKGENMLASEGTQSCTANEQCVLVSQTCATSCASLPVNAKFEKLYTDKRAQQCGADASAQPVCNMNTPMRAACINSRCTIDYAHAHNSHDGDYRNGGYQGSGGYSTAASTHDSQPNRSYVAPIDGPTVKILGTLEE